VPEWAFGSSRKGSAKVRLQLQSPKVAVPLKINITELMTELLPGSSNWYTLGSNAAHSICWVCETSATPAQASP
jgi:hypothetical protein